MQAINQCKKLFWLEIEDGESEDITTENEEPAISLHAITGKHANTMQLQVVVDMKLLLSLVDSRSTHYFISSTATQRLGLPIHHQANLNVSVANGEKISSLGICKGVQFSVITHSFIADFYVIPLDGFDIVLGVKWLQTLGPILWDFTSLTMIFEVNGRQITLQGQQQLFQPHLHLSMDSKQGDLEKILAEFDDIFQEPTDLPLMRSCDHRICLLPGTDPVVVRPYRYPHFQKDEIEKQCDQMLHQGIIRPSRSPFSSPVLLVRKHDGTWRFCVDYRELNSKTVKDIPYSSSG